MEQNSKYLLQYRLIQYINADDTLVKRDIKLLGLKKKNGSQLWEELVVKFTQASFHVVASSVCVSRPPHNLLSLVTADMKTGREQKHRCFEFPQAVHLNVMLSPLPVEKKHLLVPTNVTDTYFHI